MAWKWKNYGGIVAKLIPKENIKGLVKQDVIIRPGEQAIIIRDGKIEDSVTQTRLEKIGGGFGNWLRKKVDKGEDLQLLFVDTTEKEINVAIDEISKDHDKVRGTCTIRMKVNPDNAANLLSLMKQVGPSNERAAEDTLARKLWKKFGSGKDNDWYAQMVLTIDDIGKKLGGELKQISGKEEVKEQLVPGELKSKVFEPLISQYASDDIRGNPEIREKMENMVATELRKTFEMWGLNLINFYTTLEAEAYDNLESYRREKEIAIEKASIDSLPEFAEALRKIERDFQQSKSTLEKLFELDKMGILHKEDKKDIRQERDFKRQREKLDMYEEERTKELDVEWKEHIADMKEMFGEAYVKKYGVPGVLDYKERMEQWKRARREHAVDMRIKEYQGTALQSEKTKADVEKEKARMEAEKAKYNLEAYEKGMDQERNRTLEMMDKSADMMDAAKQNVPNTYVQGTQPTSEVRMHKNIGDEKTGDSATCPECGNDLNLSTQPNYCPFCGAELR